MKSNPKPYLGLRPYTEQDQDSFFGRDSDRRILTDKILSHKLTLLFAASGIGKSSLLRAAVIPHLTHPENENLDVVYCNDWVTDPIQSLQQDSLDTLKRRGRLDDEMTLEKIEAENLVEFFQFCALLTRQPLIIILDQFEEFFLYHKHSKGFKDFILQFSSAVSDPSCPVAVVISMREDFAMELNHFKSRLPTLLFENFYRLERLTIENAKDAVIQPVEHIGYRYETGFVDELLSNLTIREVIGGHSKPLPELVETIEPPYLQIVCSQLWDLDKNNPDKLLTRKTYRDHGRASGLLKSYVESVISHFSANEKKIASLCFDHLVSRYGTKVAYTAKDLAQVVGINEHNLEKILKQLDQSRILRSQSRGDVVWFELYHDLFSKSIGEWNQKFKAIQRNKRALRMGLATLAAGFLLFAAYDYGINSTSQHLRLSTHTNDNDIELYNGRQGSRDLFGLQQYVAQTGYQRNELEPDKVFSGKPVGDQQNIDVELVENLQRFDRAKHYLQIGRFERTEKLINYYLSLGDHTKVKKLIELLTHYPTMRSVEFIKSILDATDDESLQIFLVETMGTFRSQHTAEILLHKLDTLEQKPRISALKVLGQFGFKEISKNLLKYLNDSNPEVQWATFSALNKVSYPGLHEIFKHRLDNGSHTEKQKIIALLAKTQIGNYRSIILEQLSVDNPLKVRLAALKALKNDKHTEVTQAFIRLLDDNSPKLRIEVIKAFQTRREPSTMVELIPLLTDSHIDIRNAVVKALSSHSDTTIVPLLIEKLNSLDNQTKIKIIRLLGRSDAKAVLPTLITNLNSQDQSGVQIAAIEALGNTGSPKGIDSLRKLLSHNDTRVRSTAEKALSKIDDPLATSALIEGLEEFSTEKFHLIPLLLDKRQTSALIAILQLLGHENYEVRLIVYKSLIEARSRLRSKNINSTAIAQTLILLLKSSRWAARNNAMGIIYISDILDQDRLPLDVRHTLVSTVRAQVIENEPQLVDQMSDVQKRRFLMNHACALAVLGETDTLPYLLDLKFHGQELMGKMAETALAKMRGKTFIETLIPYLNDDDPAIRLYVLGLLNERAESSALESLSPYLKHRDPKVRTAIVSLIGKLGDMQMGERLTEQLREERNVEVLLAIIQTLGKIKYEQAIPALQKLLNDPDEEVVYETAFALAKLGHNDVTRILGEQLEKLINRQYSVDNRNNRISELLDILGHSNDPETLKLFRQLADNKNLNNSQKRRVIATLVSSNNPEATDLLINGLYGGQYELSIQTMKKNNNPLLIQKLIAQLDNKNSQVKKTTIKALGGLADPRALPTLHNQLDDSDVSIQSAAISAIGQIGSPSSINDLLKLLSHPNRNIRNDSVTALGLIQNPDAVPALENLLSSKSSSINIHLILDAFGSIGDPQVIPRLIEMLTDPISPNLDTKRKLIENLGKLRAQPVVSELLQILQSLDFNDHSIGPKNKETKLRSTIIQTLGDLQDKTAIGTLIRLVQQKQDPAYFPSETLLALAKIDPSNSQIQTTITNIYESGLSSKTKPDLNTALAMAIIKPEERTAILQPILNSQDPKIREKLAQLLSSIGTNWSLSTLLSLADGKGPSVKRAVLTAIKTHGTIEHLPQVQQLLQHEDPEIRAIAIRHAGRMNTPDSLILLKTISKDTNRRIGDRATALSSLSQIGTEEATKIILDVLKSDTSSLISIGYFYLATVDKQPAEVLTFLKSQLQVIDNKIRKYRNRRNRITLDESNGVDNASSPPPSLPWQYNIAYAIAKNSPNEGIDLLSHNLARVRRGAASGLGTVSDPSLLKRLFLLRKNAKNTLYGVAAYRVIDNTLNTILNNNNIDALVELQALRPPTGNLKDIHARLEWTIEQLRNAQQNNQNRQTGT